MKSSLILGLTVALSSVFPATLGLTVPASRSPASRSATFRAVGSVTPDVWEAKTAQGLRLVRLGEDLEPEWMTEEETFGLIRSKTGFMDITETYHVRLELAAKAEANPESTLKKRVTYPPITKQTTVKAIIATLSTSNMQTNLATLTALNNRYYKATTGVTATTTIYNKLVSIAGSTAGVSVKQFTHSWGQNSVIARINGTGTGAITIFGCHLDTINQNSPTSGRAPGADDNGTGVVNLIETFRALLAAGFQPVSALEFHFNSAEEPGLLGSQAIAASYAKAGTSVKAYVNYDMTAYFAPGSKEVIALETDYISTTLNTYLRSLISAYLLLPAGEDYCGYACSDHASWYDQGFPTAMPFEAPTEYENPYIHTASDTVSATGFSWTHSLEFLKLAVAIAVELGSV